MLSLMGIRARTLLARTLLARTLLACLAFALPAAAQTVYKYRGADGQMTYSNRLIPGAELIESFEYRFAPPVAPAASVGAASTSGAAVDGRMKTQLAALDKAWSEVQAATRALAAAEARLAAGEAPLDGESTALATAPVAAATAVGGAAPAAPPAAGGPMGTRRGGGRNAEYFERIGGLEADVAKARTRLDKALKDYNQLR